MGNLLKPTRLAKGRAVRLVSAVLLSALFNTALIHVASAQVAPPLGTAEDFAVLGSSTVTNTGPTIVTGDLGVSPGTAITGFPPGVVVGGVIHAGDAVAGQAQTDTTTAYNNLAGQACDFNLTGQDLGGMTLVPGVYCFSSSAQLTGALTLNAGGDPNAAWVFQVGSTITTASDASVLLVNGAQACNVFWQIGSSATLGTRTSFVGSILALASITLTTDVDVFGRALAQNGAVTMDSNTVSVAACGVPPVEPIPPTLSKAFSPATINAGGLSTLTLTLINPDDTAATLTAPLVDTLPSGVLVSAPPTTTCSGTLTSDASSVTLTGGSIPANGFCTVTVPVTAAAGGNYLNSIASGALQTSNGNNAAPAVATLTVVAIPADVPSVGKAFSPATINAGGISTLTITLANTDDTIALITAPFTDTLPIGVVVASTPAASNTCGGTLAAPAGGTSVTLTGGSIPANGTCVVTFNVTAPTLGSYFNSIPAGALQTSNGNNAAPAVATLTVVPVPVNIPSIGKAFSPATIDAGGISTLTITLANTDDTIALITAPFTDTLPSGVVVASTPAASNTCGGTLAAPAGGTSVTLTGGSIPANGTCVVRFNVTAPSAGSYFNSIPAGALQTSNGSNASPATATLIVRPKVKDQPQLSKSFSPATVPAGDRSLLTITLTNPGRSIATLTAPLVDYLPSGVRVANNPHAGTTCGGTVVAPVDGTTITLNGGSIPAKGSCVVEVKVVSDHKGTYLNKLPAGALQTDQGSNTSPATATLTVTKEEKVKPTLSKSFSPTTISAGKQSLLTIILSNQGNTVAKLNGPLVDYLPSGVWVAGNASTSCGGKVVAPVDGTTVTLNGGAIPAKGSCQVQVKVTAKNKGSYYNVLPAGALQTDQGNNSSAATATLTVTKSSY